LNERGSDGTLGTPKTLTAESRRIRGDREELVESHSSTHYNSIQPVNSLGKTTRLSKLRHALLSWYDENKRDLPWRKDRDPYRIWVSEIMLQQTRVAAVVDRYEQFLRRFPNVQSLAAARESAVLAEWSGLGYYRRARNLRAAAKLINANKAFPQNAAGWDALPGIGRYTAAAVASIAFGEPVAVVDGNVERVLRRLFGEDVRNSWATAQQLIDQQRPGDFNQAMMELGATVCVPIQPLCAKCPLISYCHTRGPGESTNGRARQHKRETTRLLMQSKGAVVLVRRPERLSIMPGMWELPEIAKPLRSDQQLFSVRHSITVTDYRVRVISRAKAPVRGKWIRVARIKELALTGLTKKILREAGIIQ
jgi:A/G-specific adenine glycosylase